jgi:hypothetical protein
VTLKALGGAELDATCALGVCGTRNAGELAVHALLKLMWREVRAKWI